MKLNLINKGQMKCDARNAEIVFFCSIPNCHSYVDRSAIKVCIKRPMLRSSFLGFIVGNTLDTVSLSGVYGSLLSMTAIHVRT